MQRLEDVLLYAGNAKKVIALVSRDKRLARLTLAIPAAATTWRLAIADVKKAERWLSGVAEEKNAR